MAEALIASLLEPLASSTFGYIRGEMKLFLDVKEVDKFGDKLKTIEAVLQDADQKQVTDGNVRIWLDNLKKISYQMVDVLDEWNTDMQVQKQKENEDDDQNAVVRKKVCFPIFSSCFCFGQVNRVIRHHNIAHQIKEMNVRLKEICEQTKMFQFQSIETNIQQLAPVRQKTSSIVDLTKVFGRENEKDRLIQYLLSENREESEGFLIISIVGMGGMGKTTLTQLVYNDEKVKAHFEKTIWVCVSEPFDLIEIAKAIIAICGGSAPSSNELDHVLQCMSGSLKEKRFLIVLDDVWNKDKEKWEKLEVALSQSGAKGSRILVTTRKLEVVKVMSLRTQIIDLKGLSEEICLSIFNHMAFFDKAADECKAFEDISEKIVRRCKGLPLAAKTLGSLMRHKRSMKEWKDVLSSKIWDLKEVKQEVFQPLFLSYNDLDPKDKICLLYCAIFPKDFDFERDELIELWMAQDYLNSKENKDKRIMGGEIFDNLVSRSFFQDFRMDLDGTDKVEGCKMHDIVHDFLQFLTKNEFLVMKVRDESEHDFLQFLPKNEFLVMKVGDGAAKELEGLDRDTVRHLRLMGSSYGQCQLPTSSIKCKILRTLMAFGSHIWTINSNEILQLKRLRTLNLRDNSIEEVPEEIGKLIHLRHIDLSDNGGLKKLPETICDLYNLHTLRISGCHALVELPHNIGRLINLKHLYVRGCTRLQYFPKGIGRLKGLQRLDWCIVLFGDKDEEGEALQFGDLRSLNSLEGSVVIELKGNVEDVSQVEKAQFWDKKQLFHVHINCINLLYKWKESSIEILSSFRPHQDRYSLRYKQKESSIDILNAFRPHQDLESLGIEGHHGNICPNWMMSLNNLRILKLTDWIECGILPPLGKLPFLERLAIRGMELVEKVGVEFLGIEDEAASSSSSSSSSRQASFPKLKQLTFEFMYKWEAWEGVQFQEDDSEIKIMPCLSDLVITCCPRLKSLPDFLFNRIKTPLQHLNTHGCWGLATRYERGSDEWHKISHIPHIRFDEIF